MHEGHRERVREKVLNGGMKFFAEHEVLEFILFHSIKRADTNPIAHNLLDEFGSLAAVLDADPKDLMKVKGMGEVSAALIKAVHDSYEFYQKSRWREKPFLQNSSVTGAFAAAQIGNSTNEIMIAICLNVHREVINVATIGEGTNSVCEIKVRKAVDAAVRSNAEYIVLAHNHPSGSLHPSEDDLLTTREICSTFKGIGIGVLDHIIVAGEKFTSLADRGMMQN